MLECNQVAYIVLGVQREIRYKGRGNFYYEVLPDGTNLDRLDRRKIYRMHIKEDDGPLLERKITMLLGTKIESCDKPEWDYRKFKKIDLKTIEKKIEKTRKPLLDILNSHELDVKEDELQLYLVAVHA